MQTATFRRNLDRCIDLAKSERVVLMCGGRPVAVIDP
jgi:hypothetical protein